MPAWIIAWRAGAWPTPPLHHVPHQDLFHLVGLDAGAVHGLLDGDRAELRRGHGRKPSQELADGGPAGAHDVRITFGHV
jgi:hypothetical protein